MINKLRKEYDVMVKNDLIFMLETTLEEDKLERDYLFESYEMDTYLTEAGDANTGESVLKRLIDGIKSLIKKIKDKISKYYQSSVIKKKIDRIKETLDKNSKLKNEKIHIKNNSDLVKLQNRTIAKLKSSKNPDKDMEEYNREKIKLSKKMKVGIGIAVTIATFIGGYAIYSKSVSSEIKKTEDDIRDIEEKYGQFEHKKIDDERGMSYNVINKKRYLAILHVHRDKLRSLNQDIMSYDHYSFMLDQSFINDFAEQSFNDDFNLNALDIQKSSKSGSEVYELVNGSSDRPSEAKEIINRDYHNKMHIYHQMKRPKKDSYDEDISRLIDSFENFNKTWNQLFS